MNAEMLSFDLIASPIGDVRLRFDAAGLHAVDIFAGSPTQTPSAGPTPYPQRSAFERYFDGEIDALQSLPIVMHGSEFQRRVWTCLRKIPAGTTLSYARLAEQIGKAGAARAVGSANGRNPLCIVVPCHRVISADGTLGGFSAGLDAKRWLLRHEGATFKA